MPPEDTGLGRCRLTRLSRGVAEARAVGLPHPSRRKNRQTSGTRGEGLVVLWDNDSCLASVEVIGEVAVVTVEGALTIGALPVCRNAVDQALVGRPQAVILDLQAVREADAAVPVLGLIRRYVHRHGVPLWLAGAPTIVLQALSIHCVVDLYRAMPSVTEAVEAASC